MDRHRLRKIGFQFSGLCERFDSAADRATKSSQLARHVDDYRTQAGRLLIEAIDLGGFPRERRVENRGWWDRRQARFPGLIPALYGEFPQWALKNVTVNGVEFVNQPDPEANARILADAVKPLEDWQCLNSWYFAVGSWLAGKFPERFRPGANQWDWNQAVVNAKGQPLDRDLKPLVGRWYRNGKRLPKSFVWSPKKTDAAYQWKRDGIIANKTDFYDESDWLNLRRIQAEISSDACRLLAELIEATVVAAGIPPGLIEAAAQHWSLEGALLWLAGRDDMRPANKAELANHPYAHATVDGEVFAEAILWVHSRATWNTRRNGAELYDYFGQLARGIVVDAEIRELVVPQLRALDTIENRRALWTELITRFPRVVDDVHVACYRDAAHEGHRLAQVGPVTPTDLMTLTKAAELVAHLTGNTCSDDTIRRRTRGAEPLLMGFQTENGIRVSEAEVREKAWRVKVATNRRGIRKRKPTAE
ncbi:MAG: hypothetical protein HRU76_03930 [Phycisphaeraceae bacterium]|nr:hypothetical protein [Phycisphaerales bacterium]QOJ16783.1 MAG: hypothetical protein HRU76_03930 [Phycisphaeraceae bacterium]